jgi:hypothetical protein
VLALERVMRAGVCDMMSILICEICNFRSNYEARLMDSGRDRVSVPD